MYTTSIPSTAGLSPLCEEQEHELLPYSPPSSPHHRGSIYLLRKPSFEKLYKWERSLGFGGEGRVDQFIIRATGKFVAIKTCVSPGVPTDSVAEVRMLTEINRLPEHENVTRMLQVWERETSQFQIVMPYYPGGDLCALYSRAEKFGCKLPEAFLSHAYSQLASGLSFLHENGISHRDLKPHNIVVEPTSCGTLFDNMRIIDFGCAEFGTAPHIANCGTPKWQPPGSPQNAGAKADVWAIGACVYFLATGKAPKAEFHILKHGVMNEHAIHDWYRSTPAQVQRLVHDDYADFEAGTISLTEARQMTYGSITRLPTRGYSPLLEYHILRALDTDPRKRASAHALLGTLAEDAEKQIAFYQEWVKVAGKRPMMQFIYPEPPAGWSPRQPIV